MKITVDRDRCVGSAYCQRIAPTLFDLGDGVAVVLDADVTGRRRPRPAKPKRTAPRWPSRPGNPDVMPGDEERAPRSGSPIVAGRPLHDMGILVTGGGSGIGLGISRTLLADGAAVTIVGRSAQRLEEGRQDLVAAGADPAAVRAHAADMSREDPCRRAVEAASELRGGLHAAVACAGEPRGQMAPVTQLDLDRWHSVFENNVVATMLTLKYAARALVRAGGGSFIAISSISSTLAARFTSPIASAKAAVDQLPRRGQRTRTEQRARERRPARPGQGGRQGLPDEIERDFRSAVVLPRLGARPTRTSCPVYRSPDERGPFRSSFRQVPEQAPTARRADASPWVEPIYGRDGMRGVV
jgi:NAD(P)-dependent dehydrogenase (short-subunit alcohol dehydrogenase family)/ferredoxin